MAGNSPTPTGRRIAPRRALAWVSALGFVLVVGLLVVLSWPTSDDDAATSGAGLSGSSAGSVAVAPEPSANDGPAVPGAASLRAAEPLLGPATATAPATGAHSDPLDEIVLRGRVVDETGAPVGGATVICIPDSATQRQRGLVLFSAAADLSTLTRTTTDALGRFELRDHGVLPGQTVADGLEPSELAAFALPEARSAPFPCLAILTERYAPAAHPCLGFESGEYDAGDIAVEPGGWLAGRAVDETGRPVAGAAVVPQRAAFEPRHDTPRPDAMTAELLGRLSTRVAASDGRFEIGPLWNGSAGLGLSAAFFRTTNGGPFQVSAGERLDVGDVVLRRGLSIAGYVVDGDGHPVAGARVYAGESAAREFAPDPKLDAALLDLRDFSLEAPVLTDRDGRFVVSTLAAGSQRLFVDAAHFELSLQFGLEPPLDGLRIELVRASTLELTVVDAGTGAPLAEATVAAVRRRRSYAPVQKEARVPVLAGQAAGLGPGAFRVERLGTQRTDLVVSAPGHEPAALALEGVAPGTTLTREVRLSRGATIAGRVLDLYGGGLAGAVVTVMKTVDSTAATLVALGYVGPAAKTKEKPPVFATDDAPTAALGLATPARATSGDDGGYVLQGVGPGPWTVRATLAGHQPSDRPVEVAAGARLDDVDLQMESGGVLFGTVTGSTGLLERGVLVRARFEARPKAWAESRETYSDVNGEFELDELRPGTWSIGRGREGPRQRVELAAGARLRVDIAAELVGTVSGRLLADGVPIEGMVMARRAVDKPAAKDRLKVRTDKTGHFQIQLLPGEWLLRGYGAEPAFGMTESARVSIGARQAPQLDLALAGSAVSGRVTDAQSGQPIAGATISLQTEGAAQPSFLGVPNPGGPKAPGFEVWPRTDAQGRFVLPHVPADTYTALANHPDYQTATREAVALGAGAETTLELTMTHTSGLNVTVKLPSGEPVPAGFTLLVTEVDGGTEIGKGVKDGVVEFIRLEPGTYNLYVFGPKPSSFKTGTSGEPPLLEKQVALSLGERQELALVVQP